MPLMEFLEKVPIVGLIPKYIKLRGDNYDK